MRASALAVSSSPPRPRRGGRSRGDAAPETRAEQWTRLRREKAARVGAAASPASSSASCSPSRRPSARASSTSTSRASTRARSTSRPGRSSPAASRLWRPDLGDSRDRLHGVGLLLHPRVRVLRPPARPPAAPRATGSPPARPAATTCTSWATCRGSTPAAPSSTARCATATTPRRRSTASAPTRARGRTNFLHQDALYEVVAGYQGPRGLAATVGAGFMQAFVGPGTDDDVAHHRRALRRPAGSRSRPPARLPPPRRLAAARPPRPPGQPPPRRA